MNILVTGGSGMVGKELKKRLPEATYVSSRDFDLCSESDVKKMFSQKQYDYVVHLAAHVGSLHDNIENQVAYYDTNVFMNTLVTHHAHKSGVKNFLGILSTCIYPDNVNKFPMEEEVLHNGKPHESLMSYAYAKRSHSVQLDAYSAQFGVNYKYLIPCNLYGIPNESHKDRLHFVNDLVRKIIDAKKAGRSEIRLFGDGTPLRQFMYAPDFAHVIERYIRGNFSINMNVAATENLSVDTMAKMAIESCDAIGLKIVYDSSKPNGQMRKDVSIQRLKSVMPDFEFTPLKAGIRDLYLHLTEGKVKLV